MIVLFLGNHDTEILYAKCLKDVFKIVKCFNTDFYRVFLHCIYILFIVIVVQVELVDAFDCIIYSSKTRRRSNESGGNDCKHKRSCHGRYYLQSGQYVS